MTTTSLVHRRRTTLPLLAIAGALALTTVTACTSDASDIPVATAPAAIDPATTTAADTAVATPLTCAGAGIDADSPIHYRSEIMIDAPMSTVWDLHTDAARWPSWQQPVTSIRLTGPEPLAVGSQFQWTTPAPATPTTPATTLTITSTVHELQPHSCVRWSGPAIGDGLNIDNGVHVWNFSEVDGAVLVQTEESWTGSQVEGDVPTSTAFLGAGLDAWLSELEATAESKP
ncbi:SRPBCC family protein [Rhodococcus sp. G-MC3]|uniref:SRPBCC family protein n=1 Tax=Rhodococcus sp. G-MC3 TaxID=3046209 RepID=UPI0024BA0F5B|nr:SRPBCC family protein [Rhodococcus sp. G-MC3]MDJ0392442.1 SRPBCC family protein [Rhodococcus sp. G-MC3]